MKTLILIILSAGALVGQDLDSLKRAVVELRAGQQQINLRLEKSHKQFRLGTSLIAAGVLASAADLLVMRSGRDIGDKVAPKPILTYVGTVLTTAGVIIQIDAHRHTVVKRRRKH